MTAHKIKKLEGWMGTAWLYRLEPPFEGEEYVVSSACIAPFSGSETLVFRSNEHGEVSSFLDLDGSYRGGLDNDRAIRNMGYEVRED